MFTGRRPLSDLAKATLANNFEQVKVSDRQGFLYEGTSKYQ